MTTRRLAIAAAMLAATLADTQTASGSADVLFVQTANRMTFNAAPKRMTLHEVSPVNMAIADRPERIAASMRTVEGCRSGAAAATASCGTRRTRMSPSSQAARCAR
jgi:hypothetical protein